MISSVVPTKSPSTRAVNGPLAGSASRHAPATPRVWFGMLPNRLGRWLTERTSGAGRTRAAHCCDVGSADFGGSSSNRPVDGGAVVVVVVELVVVVVVVEEVVVGGGRVDVVVGAGA